MIPFQLHWIQWHQFVCTDRVDFCHEFSTIPGFHMSFQRQPHFCWHPFASVPIHVYKVVSQVEPTAKNGRIGCVASSKWGDAPTCRSKEAKCQRFQGTSLATGSFGGPNFQGGVIRAAHQSLAGHGRDARQNQHRIT